VHTQQHDGTAHAEGWPFPLWTQAGGIGWHFAPVGVPGHDAPRVTPDGWQLSAAHGEPINAKGWPIVLIFLDATAKTPTLAPFLMLIASVRADPKPIDRVARDESQHPPSQTDASRKARLTSMDSRELQAGVRRILPPRPTWLFHHA
jgi:hypothetical protein